MKEAEKKAAENVELVSQEKMRGGISNFQIEEAFKNINDSDINGNFVGAFPANQMTKFIDYKSMISEKRKMSLLDSKY